MARFIKLHDQYQPNVRYVNSDHISNISNSSATGSLVYLVDNRDDYYHFKETPEEIMELINAI